MRKEELIAGVWIAQGPEINVLVHLTGKSPMLRVIGAIDLNAFYSNGEVRPLQKDSIEIQDILMYPEKYQFETINTSSTVENTLGYNCDSDRDEETITEEFINSAVAKYRQFLKITGDVNETKTKVKIWLKREHQFSVSQAEYFVLNKILPRMKPNSLLQNRNE